MPFDIGHRQAPFPHRDTAGATARLAALLAPAPTVEQKRARYLAERNPLAETERHLSRATGSLRNVVSARAFQHAHMIDAADRAEREDGWIAYAAEQLAAAIRCVDEVVGASDVARAA